MEDLPVSELVQQTVASLLWPAASGQQPQQQQDRERWFAQGFDLLVDSHGQCREQFPVGLVQGHGGPCGVLAVVQAEMLRLLLFHSDCTSDERRQQELRKPRSDRELNLLLAQALAAVLFTCTAGRQQNPASRQVHVVFSTSPFDQLQRQQSFVHCEYKDTLVSVADASDPALVQLILRHIGSFRSAHGVVLFLFSCILTKGIDQIRSEMDDPQSTLTGNFGHCAQELLNLLLTGFATSNVFDGEVPMGDTGLFLHGVAARPRVGYLSQLEALRYCQVGQFFKTPESPIWVVGSSSHFSVLFGTDTALCEQSREDKLLADVRRVFQRFDPSEKGFLELSVLADSLRQSGVPSAILGDEYAMNSLVNRLEMSPGAGIVLWEDFWSVVSVLIATNGDLERAIATNIHGEGESISSGASQQQVPAPALVRSDSDLARELQAQFDAEEQGTEVIEPMTSVAAAGSGGNAPTPSTSTVNWFELHYYNGLHNARRVPQLVSFRLGVPQKSSIIGRSAPLVDSSRSGGHGNPLEEIIKTKWPDAALDWRGQPPGSID